MKYVQWALAILFLVTGGTAFADRVTLGHGIMTGTWQYNGTHSYQFSEVRGQVHGTGVTNTTPRFTSEIYLDKVRVDAYEGVAVQRSSDRDCDTTFFLTYTVLSPDRVRVNLNGSDGTCGFPDTITMSYVINRVGSVRIPNVSGTWYYNGTHTYRLQTDRSGRITGRGVTNTTPRYTADLELDYIGNDVFEGIARQRSSSNPCVETFYLRYTVVTQSRILVSLNGSDGVCGSDPNIRFSYYISR